MEKLRNAHIFFGFPNASIGNRAMTWKKISSFFAMIFAGIARGSDVRRCAR
jgi:hypothetical protein